MSDEWDPAQWTPKPVPGHPGYDVANRRLRQPLPKAPKGALPTWLGMLLAAIVAVCGATIIFVCTWLLVSDALR